MECLRGGVVYLYPLAAAVVVADGIVANPMNLRSDVLNMVVEEDFEEDTTVVYDDDRRLLY